ncbi:MAG: DNA ligase LigA-related protein [Bilophila wadsworthia]
MIYHNHRYHTLDAPEITDDEYNAAFQELLRLEERHPERRSPDSPTNRIGGQVFRRWKPRPIRGGCTAWTTCSMRRSGGAFSAPGQRQAGLEHAFGVIRKWTASPLSLCMRTGGLSKH